MYISKLGDIYNIERTMCNLNRSRQNIERLFENFPMRTRVEYKPIDFGGVNNV